MLGTRQGVFLLYVIKRSTKFFTILYNPGLINELLSIEKYLVFKFLEGNKWKISSICMRAFGETGNFVSSGKRIISYSKGIVAVFS